MIEIRALTKTFGSGTHATTVLDGIDFAVGRGEAFAIVGPSGAGKSTLAHCINLLERPTSGAVVVDGVDLTTLGAGRLRAARRAIGTVFQASSLLSRRTAAENVALPLEYLGVTRRERAARVAELLERVGLSHRAGHLPHQLSGGQRQRVGIARALALRPSVLLADEATSGLDPGATASVLALLQEIRRDLGLTVILITHEMAVVREVADRAALLEGGRIVEQGAVVDLVTDPASLLGRALLPAPASATPGEGDEAWKVSYGSDAVPADWIDRLGRLLDTQVSLLAASIEPIAGVLTGRATIAIAPRPATAVHEALATLGLHGERVSAQVAVAA